MKIGSITRLALGEWPGLGKNVFWLLISRFGTQGLMVVFTLVLARRLGSETFGAYAFIAALVFMGNALTTFGTDMILIREIAAKDDLSGLMPALAIQLALSGGLIALTWAAASYLPNQSPETIFGLQVCSLSLLPMAFFSVFSTALRGRQRMDGFMALNLFLAAVQVGLTLAFVRPGDSVVWLVWLLNAGQFAGAVFGGILCGAQIPGFWNGWRFSWPETAALAQLCAPVALIALAGIVYQKISVYMVSTLAGPAPTGWFSAALRVIEAAKTVHLAVFTALYPVMASASAASIGGTTEIRKPWRGSFRQAWRLLIVGSIAASAGLFLFARPLVQILYGPEYFPAILEGKILAWILIPFTANTFLSLSILASQKEHTVLRVQMVGLVALIGLNAWWIPKWGIDGACLAMLAAEISQAVLYMLPKEIFLPDLKRLFATKSRNF